jgi:predicted DCC family thiol-disulfide oxidoreductase YuxK
MNSIGYVVYDGECPFCSRYVRMLRLRAAVGSVELVNARSDHPVVAFLRERQIDLNDGMAFVQEGQVSYGAECIYKLALLTTPSGSFNQLNAWVFRSATASRLLYPILRFGRNMTLKLLGRRKLDPPTAPQS